MKFRTPTDYEKECYTYVLKGQIVVCASMFPNGTKEPGYYEDRSFGIRLVLVVPAKPEYNYRNRGSLTFEMITLVPIQTKMINTELLTQKERDWLNEYHRQCREITGAELQRQGRKAALDWLVRETQPI
ncbi:hypothetical protein ACEWY4_017974 [Coilia grayii]|uniref:Peptidase M24 C-terminal domain-containing protein n=1 Tax=Coilia grayii TaxID=363190 RepID=A0ABD1JIH5_9TELE